VGNNHYFVFTILLQPVINYTPAKEKGLGCSLFQRYAEVSEKREQPVGLCQENSLIMLKTQYRMVLYSRLVEPNLTAVFFVIA